MAALNPVFQSESERIHSDHQELLSELSTLDLALEHMGSGSADMTDTHCVVKARAITLAMARRLPELFMREENNLFKTVAEVSHELSIFVGEMKREHITLFVMVNSFCVALDELANAAELKAAVRNLKELGMDVSRALRHHLTTEARELQGFL
jgi:predicted O-linked N-acetylglucosamine transferase (SPINDLY family)